MPLNKMPILPPWGGWNDSASKLSLPPNSFQQIQNFIINKNRLLSFPNIEVFSPQVPNSAYPYAMRTFQDTLANLHSVVICNDGSIWYIDPSQSNGYNQILNPDTTGGFNPGINAWQNPPIPLNPIATEVMYGKLFFTNGGPSPLLYVDGGINLRVAGDVPGSSFFLFKLSSHLIMANTVEPDSSQYGSIQHPARYRWSQAGNPLVWITNPVTDLPEPTAGFEDIADVEDSITGAATLSNNLGYLFRNNGITVIADTGTNAPTFASENFCIGEKGVGCAVPYSLGVFGNFCVFVGTDDIYYFDGSAPQRIGGNAKNGIFADLAAVANTPGWPPYATTFGSLLGGIDFMSYWLVIPYLQNLGPGNSTSVVWIYHFDSQTWIREILPYHQVLCLDTLVTE